MGNPVSGGGTFTFNQGATVYDALCACGLSMNASNTVTAYVPLVLFALLMADTAADVLSELLFP